VVAGPSGVGKGTIVRHVLERLPRVRLSVSATTRPPRSSEHDGVDYLFVTGEAFAEMARSGGLLEWAEVFDHLYGTPVAPVRKALDEGRDVLLEIDVQGAWQVKERMPGAILVLLEPPSLDELERRLRSRGTEDEEDLERRLEKVVWELDQRSWFDHVVVNDDVERATEEVAAIIQASPPATEGPSRP
jgi:guanylate kinase